MSSSSFFVYLRYGDDVLVERRALEILFPSFTPTDGNLAQVYQVNAYLSGILADETFVRRPLLSGLAGNDFVIVHECDFVEEPASRPEPRMGFAWLSAATLSEALTRESERLLAVEARAAQGLDLQRPDEAFGLLTRQRFARIREELSRVVRDDTGCAPLRIEQFRHWDRSSLFRCVFEGATEPQFAKYVPPFLAAERNVASWFASRYPLNAVRVRAQLGEESGYVMDSLPSERLERRPDVECWKRALALHSGIQRRAQEDIASGFLTGVPVRDLAWLRTTMTALFVSEDLRTLGLHEDEEEGFRAAIPKFWQVLEAFEGMALPVSLVHGDLWPGNVALEGERTVIFDWSDACIAPAFFDLSNFLMDLEGELGSEGAMALPSLVDAYGRAWADVFPPERLVGSFDALRALTHAHSAAFYWAEILPRVAHPWQLRNMLPHNLSKMIEALDAVNSK